MTDAELQALAADVRYLKDRAEILDCMNRYTRGADRLDRDLFLSSYHDDATDDRGAFTGNPRQRVDWLFEYLATLDHAAHHISNFTLEIDGDVCHAESYVITTTVPAGSKSVTMGTARYLDRLERRNGEWKIAHREGVFDFVFTVPTSENHPGVAAGKRDASDRSYARPLDLTPEAAARIRAGLTQPAD
jgi:hypothetical protein